MSAEPTDALGAFCGRHGIRGPLVREPVGAGRNSRVTRLGNQDGQWILKEYGPRSLGGQDGHDRLRAEFAFLQYLDSGDVADVARPLGADRDLGCALYSWLPGARPTHITADHIAQAAQFIVSVNRDRTLPRARALAAAADACQGPHDHLALIRTRLTQLTALEPLSVLEEQALALVIDRYVPAWHSLEETLIDGMATTRNTTPILSPSDFGFHNTLAHQGRLAFVDFEYAGWDDPAKLICDFICQPELPITPAQGMQFIEYLSGAFPDAGELRRRVEWLLPAHRLKWCCILLNEFRPEYHRRRVHAGIASEGLLRTQLAKAERYFEEHMSACMPRAISGNRERIHPHNPNGET
jgi:hypothetical protein